ALPGDSQLMSELVLKRNSFGVSDASLAQLISSVFAVASLESGDPADQQQALTYLQLSPDLQELAENKIAEINEIAAQAAANRPRTNAKNLASVFSSAVAAGADFADATDTASAIHLMTEGVYGSDSFSTTKFQVPPLSEEDLAQAAAYLDFSDGRLSYKVDTQAEAGAIRGIERTNLAITRAEAINMAIAAYIQSRGRTEAELEWDQAEGEQARYETLAPFLAFAPTEFEDYMPEGYSIEMPKALTELRKRHLMCDGVAVVY
ncbi:MAG: hypothetical protein ACR2RV_17315, partial [Verrucomicrobiales bacterium]